MKKYIILLILGLAFTLAGCPSTTTKLNSLKANYNAGNYDIVLGETTGDKIYSADEVIKEAKKDKEQIIVQQAKLIQARARIYSVIDSEKNCPTLTKLKTSNNPIDENTSCGKLQQSINEILELNTNTLPYEWMRVEVAASVADSLHLCNKNISAFYAYDYLVSHYDYSDMQQTLFNYILHWANAYEQAKGNKEFKVSVEKQYNATLKKLTKKYPGKPGIIYAEIIQDITSGQQVEAIQKAMILRAFLPRSTSTNKDFIALLDKQIQDESSKEKTPDEIKYSYPHFIDIWKPHTTK